MMAQVCPPSTGEKRQGDPWGSQASQHRHVWQVIEQWELLFHKTRLKASKKTISEAAFWLVYTHTYIHIYNQTNTYNRHACTHAHINEHFKNKRKQISE